MSGRELADAMGKRRPGLRVLYTSGYTDNAIVHHGRLDAGVLLLTKPYRRPQLAQMVRRALGGDAGPVTAPPVRLPQA
jgi:FixJ family two-component response regulator